MNLLEAVKQRRAVKHYDPEHRFSKEEVEQLLQTALLSPTSFNIQNWRIVQVEDPALRQQVREVAWNQSQITDASLLFAMCADLRSWGKEPQRYWQNAPEEVQKIIVPAITPFYEGKEQLQRDEAMRSVGIISQTIMLSAKAMGYDSCPMIGFDPEKVAELIKLPENHVLGMLLAVGKGIKPANPRGGQLPLEEVLVKNTF
ncbi:UNVERIFIED_CONTAM: hypothetical protein GTU68_024421 [Idotea baltica]|nr:hypothetical protein [Idotea baltica]